MREKIKEVLKRVLELDDVNEDISQRSCVQWDSLNHLNLIVELEEVFEVSFEPEDIAEMKSLDILEQKIKKLKELK